SYSTSFVFSFFFSSRRRHTRSKRDWSSDVCSSDLHIMKICHYPNYKARYHFVVQLTFEHLIHRHFWRINFHIYLPSFEDSMAVRGKRYNGPLKKNTKPRLLFGSRYYSK